MPPKLKQRRLEDIETAPDDMQRAIRAVADRDRRPSAKGAELAEAAMKKAVKRPRPKKPPKPKIIYKDPEPVVLKDIDTYYPLPPPPDPNRPPSPPQDFIVKAREKPRTRTTTRRHWSQNPNPNPPRSQSKITTTTPKQLPSGSQTQIPAATPK